MASATSWEWSREEQHGCGNSFIVTGETALGDPFYAKGILSAVDTNNSVLPFRGYHSYLFCLPRCVVWTSRAFTFFIARHPRDNLSRNELASQVWNKQGWRSVDSLLNNQDSVAGGRYIEQVSHITQMDEQLLGRVVVAKLPSCLRRSSPLDIKHSLIQGCLSQQMRYS